MDKTNSSLLPPLPDSVNAGRIPDWDTAKLIGRSCPVCRSTCSAEFTCRPDGLIVVRCKNCDCLYVQNVPDETQINQFYQQYAQFKYPATATHKLSFLQKYLGVRTNAFVKILLESGGIKGKRITDYGCSYGHLLQLLQYSGAKVSGIEVDKEALSFLKKCQIPTYETLAEMPLNDVICAMHIVEHLYNPADFFAQISSALVEDGRLLLALPNGGQGLRVGATWIGFRVDFEHINYFSIETLNNILNQHGLFIELFWEHGQPYVNRENVEKSGRWKPWINRFVNGWWLPKPNFEYNQGSFELVVLARKCC